MDDGGDAAKARSLMKELVEDRKAVAVVAAMSVVETLNSWRKYVEDEKVPVVGGSCGPEWTASPMLFRQCPGSPAQIYGTALVGAKHAKSKKFGGLFCSETESCTFVEKELFGKGGAKRAGLDPRYRARMSVFQADFTAECIQAQNSGVELLMVVADPGTVERVASSCRRQGLTPQYLQIASTIRAGAVGKPGCGRRSLYLLHARLRWQMARSEHADICAVSRLACVNGVSVLHSSDVHFSAMGPKRPGRNRRSPRCDGCARRVR